MILKVWFLMLLAAFMVAGCFELTNTRNTLYDDTYSKTMSCYSGGEKVNCW